jgi:hypothetical protein
MIGKTTNPSRFNGFPLRLGKDSVQIRPALRCKQPCFDLTMILLASGFKRAMRELLRRPFITISYHHILIR